MNIADGTRSGTFDSHKFEYVEMTVRGNDGRVREVELVSPSPIDAALNARFADGKGGTLALSSLGTIPAKCVEWTNRRMKFSAVPETDAQPTA
jgi:hypothetical protein